MSTKDLYKDSWDTKYHCVRICFRISNTFEYLKEINLRYGIRVIVVDMLIILPLDEKCVYFIFLKVNRGKYKV